MMILTIFDDLWLKKRKENALILVILHKLPISQNETDQLP